MNIKYINPFIKATSNAIGQLTGKVVSPKNPYRFEKNGSLVRNYVSGIIGLAGDVIGMVVISMQEEVAHTMISSIVGLQNPHDITEELIYDAVGEFINIIAGNAKKDMEEFRIAISLPSIVIGDRHKIGWIQSVPVVGVPFASDIGEVSLFVSMKNLINW